MSQELFQRLEKLFFELEQLDVKSRERRLEELRGSDPALAEHLRHLLQAHTTEILPSKATPNSGSSDLAEASEPVPLDLQQGSPSRFRLVKPIGEGGMGTVHEAEQLEPVQRRVAIKLIRGAVASRKAITRFEAERQTLATLSHPNIARVFEAGADQEGRLFFAMELVDGTPITEYCDQHRLATRQRLELFKQVCDGVAHAHRNGVIHRDLKPSNILVEEADGRVNAKIIDFGIAKVVSPWDSDQDTVKARALPIGTPEYMSPEQFQGGPIDTRSDIYALGVLLFELLVGQLPISGQTLRDKSIEEMRRQVRDQPTPTPSSRVATETEGARLLADLRNTAPAALARILRGELDWIVLKALAKEPSERYDSVVELSGDLSDFLDDRPVSVAPRTWQYRLKKWARRNRLGASVAAAALIALLLGVTGLAVGLSRARSAENKAQQEAAVRGEVINFLRSLLSSGAQSLEQGEAVTVRDLFVRAQERLREDPPSDPLVRGTLLNRIGDFHHMDLQDYPTAQNLYQEAEQVLSGVDGSDAERSSSVYMLGIIERLRGKLDVAEPLLLEALALREQSLGPESPGVAAVLGELAVHARLSGDIDLAVERMERAVSIAETSSGPDSDGTLAEKLNLSGIYGIARRFDDARRVNLEVLEVARQRDLPLYESIAINNLGQQAVRTGDLVAAARYLDEAAHIQKTKLDADPTRLEVTLANTGMVMALGGDYDNAVTRLEEALTLAEQSTGVDGTAAASLHLLIAQVAQRTGDLERCRQSVDRALEIYQGVTAENPNVSPIRAVRLLALADEAEGALDAAQGKLAAALADDQSEEHRFDPEGECLLRLELLRLEANDGTARTQGSNAQMESIAATCQADEVWDRPQILTARAATASAMGDIDSAIELFERVSQFGRVDAWFGIDPALAAIREDPRSAEALARLLPH